MSLEVLHLPLFNSPDYRYSVSLEGSSFEIRIYYNERVEWWAIDVRHSDGDPIVLGQRLSIEHPLFLDYVLDGLTGMFWLEPKGKFKNQTLKHPLELHKYYNLFYYFEEDDEEE